MKKIVTLIAVTVVLTGCASIMDHVPSFWDDNQSRVATNIRLSVEKLDCTQAQAPQVSELRDQIRWFQLYSESKGSLQKDVLRVMEPMSRTVDEWSKRVSDGVDASKAYCEAKKRIMKSQARLSAQAILGRY